MKKMIVTGMLSLSTLVLMAQDKNMKDVSETIELSKEVVALFSNGKITEAFSELVPYWPMPKNELQSIELKTIQYMNILNSRFGDPIGTLKVKNETISDIAIRETYLIRYANSAIRVIFTYYKNDKGWIVNAFKWDDSFTEEFE